ncbi:MAG: 30S ribosomal protein S15 [Hadesarchaea archaeon DG-33-1]|nr:MAG: 30S ribosomal protein S15 [Hadesarchaea archaeon DG-33-1]
MDETFGRRKPTKSLGGASADKIEELVAKLAKDGRSTSKIGIILRDQYGVASVKQAVGKSVAQILKAHGIKHELPEDLMNLIKKAVALRRHLARNRRDSTSKHGLEVIEARIQRLAKYYARTGLLPTGWRYEPEKAALLVR